MVEDREDQEDDHEDDGSGCSGNTKESDETDFCDVDTGQKLLEGTRVDQALGIDVAVGDEEDVVSIRGIEQGHSDGCKAENERCNTGVGDTCDRLVKSGSQVTECVPITAIQVKTGRVLPHEIALKLAHLLYIFLGVFARNLYRILKMMNPTTWERTPDATVKPCTIKYEM
jgi:hypothetical protein